MNITRDVEEGDATHLAATMKSGIVEFDAYHWSKSLCEEAAREGELEDHLL